MRANPLDGVVLLSGCDKTTPAMLMGAASVDLPAIMVTGGPMLNGKFRGAGHRFGHGDVEAQRGAARGEADRGGSSMRGRGLHVTQPRTLHDDGHGLHHGVHLRGPGHADVRRSRHSRRRRQALRAGAGLRTAGGPARRGGPAALRVLTREAFENAIRVNAALGGSTNAVVHLLALAGRVGVPLELRGLRRTDLPGAGPGRHDALGPVPHGGLLLRGRTARRHA